MPTDAFDDKLRALFVGMFLYVHERLAAHAGPDDINRVAREVLSSMDGKAKGTAPDAPHELVSISAARSLEWLRRPIRIVGRVATIRDTEVVEVPAPRGGMEQVETTAVEIADRHGDSIWSLNVVGHELVRKLHAHAKDGSCEFLGTMVLVPKGDFGLDLEPAEHRFSFALHIADVRRTASTRDLVGATSAERVAAAESLGALASAGDSPYRHLYGELVTGLGIVGLEDAPVLDAMLKFTVLQACSTGRIGNASGRLHGLVVGPPGRGKKLLGLAARALQPCAAELSAVKASPAGLVGTSYRTQDGWKSTPGLLPAAAHGVALLQDAQGLREADLRRIGPILQELIEDGMVRDSVACASERPAETSLLLDVNRLSQLRAAGANGAASLKEAPVLRLRPLLSRFDVIAEIPSDSAATWAVSLKMYEKIGSGERPLEERGWVRAARLLVAHLRDAIPNVDLSGVRGLMRREHEAFRRDNVAFFTTAPEAGDLPTRMVVSFARLVAASARAHARARAVDKDVAVAGQFVRVKLAFLCKTSCPGVQAAGATWTDPRKAREAWVASRRGVVRPADLAAEYEAARGVATHERTMRRAVQRLGAVPRGPGLYLLPAHVDTWTDRTAEVQRTRRCTMQDSEVVMELEGGGLLTYTPGFIDAETAASNLNTLVDQISWEQMRFAGFPERRLTKWIGSEPYSYTGVTRVPVAWADAPAAVRDIRALVEHRVFGVTGPRFDGVLMNYYRTGENKIGLHADNEREILPDSPIASVSLGAARKFVLKHNSSAKKVELMLEPGSLLVMSGTTQRFWKHALPPMKRVRGPRINLTFRRMRP